MVKCYAHEGLERRIGGGSVKTEHRTVTAGNEMGGEHQGPVPKDLVLWMSYFHRSNGATREMSAERKFGKGCSDAEKGIALEHT